ATTLPAMGANRSLSVLTLSMVPKALPSAMVSPGFTSRLRRVMSPSWSTAYEVMPTSTPPPSAFAHSWSLVYRRSERTSLAISIASTWLRARICRTAGKGRGAVGSTRRRTLVERGLDHDRLGPPAAAVDHDGAADLAQIELGGGRDVAEADVLADGGAGAAAGAHADDASVGRLQGVAVAGDAAARHL